MKTTRIHILITLLAILLLAACQNNTSATVEPMPTNTPPTITDAMATAGVIPADPAIIITSPTLGEALNITGEYTFTGRVQPPTLAERATLLIRLESGRDHPNFDMAPIDPVTGLWSITTFIHPKFVGEASVEVWLENGMRASMPVVLGYDSADSGRYVNVTRPTRLTTHLPAGSPMPLTGTAHNPVDNRVTIVANYYDLGGETGAVAWEGVADVTDGQWGAEIPLDATWEGERLLVETCTGDDSTDAVVWCGTFFIVVLPTVE